MPDTNFEQSFEAMRTATLDSVTDREPDPILVEDEGDDDDEAGLPDLEAEGVEEAEADPDKPAKPKTFVPQQALHAERTRRKETEKQLREFQQQQAVERARFEERFRQYQERMGAAPAAQQQPVEEEPSILDDPLHHLEKLKTQVETERRQAQERAEQQRQYTEFEQAYAQQALAYRQTNPDFDDAYNHLLADRAREYQLLGLTPQQIVAAVKQDEANIAYGAMSAGINPGERIFQLAKHRGWQKKLADGEKTPAEKAVEKTQVARNRNGTFTNAGGSAEPPAMTAEALLKMSDAEFDKWSEKNPRKFQRLMGG